jgi:molybdopterin converting factor small subunit
MKVLIPSPLRSYTADRSWVEANGSTLGAVLDDLDRQFPGIRFRMIDEQARMRRHVRFFVNGAQTFDLGLPLRESDELCIVQALSGG